MSGFVRQGAFGRAPKMQIGDSLRVADLRDEVWGIFDEGRYRGGDAWSPMAEHTSRRGWEGCLEARYRQIECAGAVKYRNRSLVPASLVAYIYRRYSYGLSLRSSPYDLVHISLSC